MRVGLPPAPAAYGRWESAGTGPKGISPAPAPSPHASPSVPAPPSPVAERQVPANRAPQAPQHRVQLWRLRPVRPFAGRERTAGEVPSRLQPALLLRRSGKKGLQRRGARGDPGAFPPPPARVTHGRAGLRHDSAKPGRAAHGVTMATRRRETRKARRKRRRAVNPADLRPLPPLRPIAAAPRPPPRRAGGGRSPSAPAVVARAGEFSAVPEVKKSRHGGGSLFAHRGRPSRRGLARNGNPGGFRRPGVKGPR